ncbi:MAG: hypothetical protein AAGJ40_09225 [Planctomycetota bacterium]
MKIWTIWVSEGGWDDAWLKDAWDEFTRDFNEAGWERALNAARDKHSDVRVIPIVVPTEKLGAAFEVQAIPGEVKP